MPGKRTPSTAWGVDRNIRGRAGRRVCTPSKGRQRRTRPGSRGHTGSLPGGSLARDSSCSLRRILRTSRKSPSRADTARSPAAELTGRSREDRTRSNSCRRGRFQPSTAYTTYWILQSRPCNSGGISSRASSPCFRSIQSHTLQRTASESQIGWGIEKKRVFKRERERIVQFLLTDIYLPNRSRRGSGSRRRTGRTRSGKIRRRSQRR